MRIRSGFALFCLAALANAQPVGRIDQHVPVDEWYSDWKVGTLFPDGDVLTAIVRWNSGAPDEPGGIYLTRIHPDGSFAWSNYLEPVAQEQDFLAYQTGLTRCANGDFLLSGTINMSVGYFRHFLARLDGAGALVWSKSFDFIAEVGDDEGTDALREHTDGTISWMMETYPSILIHLEHDGTLLSATRYYHDGDAMLEPPAWDADGGALLPCRVEPSMQALVHVTVDGDMDWAKRSPENTRVSGVHVAANGDYLLVGGHDDRPAIMRISPGGDVQWANSYSSGSPDGWLGTTGIWAFADVVGADNDEFLTNHFITASDTNLVFLRVSGSGLPLACMAMASASHTYEMHLLGIAEGRAVLAGGEWDMTGVDTSAFPVWRVPLDDLGNGPCGIRPIAVTQSAFDPVFDTITIEAISAAVGSWELPLTLAPVLMSTTYPCNPVGFAEAEYLRPLVWPVPVSAGEVLYVRGLAVDHVLGLFSVDGRSWPVHVTDRSSVLQFATSSLPPGAYVLRAVTGTSLRVVVR